MNKNEMERAVSTDSSPVSFDVNERELAPLSPEQFRALIQPAQGEEATADEVQRNLTHELEERAERALEAEFKEVHALDLGKEHLDYTILHGDKASTQKEWAVFIGGFGSIKETYKAEMFDLAQTGYNVLFVSPDQGVLPSPEEKNYFTSAHERVAETIERKAVAVSRLIDHLGISRANIIGHSQGGEVSAVLAGMRPMLAKRLILDNPAGLIGERSTGELLHGIRAEAKKEFAKFEDKSNPSIRQDIATWRKQLTKLFHFPFWRATAELPGIAHTDIRPILARLSQNKSEGGPEVILINANDDKIFRKEEVERALGENPFVDYLDRWAMYAEKDAGHGKFDRKPGLYPKIMDDYDTHTSVIHQIITEKHTPAETPSDRQ